MVRRFEHQRSFAAWYGGDRRMLVSVGTSRSLYTLSAPGAKPERVSRLPSGARYLQWSRDTVRPYVVFALDERGSERFRFYRYDLDTANTTRLTSQAARAYAGGLDRAGTRLAFMSNERNGVDSDIYVVDVQRPETKELVYSSGGDYATRGWLDDTHVLVEHLTSHSRGTLFSLDLNTGQVKPLLPGRETDVRFVDATHDRTNSVMYLAADLDGDFASLHALDTRTGAAAALIPALKWDIVSIQALADGRTLALLVNEDAQNRLYLFEIAKGTLRKVRNVPRGFLTRIAAHPTLPLLALDVLGLDGLSGVWTYDAGTDQFEAWAVSPPEDVLPPPEVIHYPTFDQVDGRPRLIPAIVVHTSTHPVAKQPVVIELHGGPTLQARTLVQPWDAIAYAGATVIRPNVRGSSGYGTIYESLDDREHREDAVRDVGALLDWIATRPDLDSSRVCVGGESYAGYLVLATLALYGNRIRCGVDLFGISDFPAFLKESEQGHFAEAQRGEFGDWRDPQMLRFLESISPVTQADRIRVPLLIYQGANDG